MPTCDVAGARLNYSDTGGDGPALLALHAWPLNSGMWIAQIDALRSRHRVIAVDLKGFGTSSAPDDPAAYSIESYAAEVKGLLATLGISRAAILGLSMGGYVALALWRASRDVFSKLILADTRSEADAPEGVARRSRQQDRIREEGTAGVIEALVPNLLGATTMEHRPDVVSTVTALMDNPASGFIGALEAMKNRPDSTGDLLGIDVPTLVMVGSEDTLTPVDAARKMHEHIGGSRLVVIPEAGHLSNLEAPAAFNETVVDFLSE